MSKRPRRRSREAAPSISQRLEEGLELPRSALHGNAHIELAGNQEAVVDGCKGVLEYDDSCIRLNTGSLVLRFTGQSLSIQSMQLNQAIITGTIAGIEFTT